MKCVCGGEIDMRKTFHVFIKTPYSVAVTSILLLCFCSRTLKTQVTIEIRKFTSASPINHSNVEVKMLCLCNFTRVTQLMTDSSTESRLSSLCGLHSVKDFFLIYPSIPWVWAQYFLSHCIQGMILFFTCNFIGPVAEVSSTHLFGIDLKQVSFILENTMSNVSVLLQCLHFDCISRLLFLCVLVHI